MGIGTLRRYHDSTPSTPEPTPQAEPAQEVVVEAPPAAPVAPVADAPRRRLGRRQ